MGCPTGWERYFGNCDNSYHCDDTPCGSTTQKWEDKYMKCILVTVTCAVNPNQAGCTDCFWQESSYDGCC